MDRDVRHRSRGRGAVPMLQPRRKPNDIARANLLHGTPFALHPAEARGDDERLSQRMSVPGSASTGLEDDQRSGGSRRFLRWKEGVDTRPAGEPVTPAFGLRLRTMADDFDFHGGLR